MEALKHADVAQLVEQLIRNEQVVGSSPIVGSTLKIGHSYVRERKINSIKRRLSWRRSMINLPILKVNSKRT